MAAHPQRANGRVEEIVFATGFMGAAELHNVEPYSGRKGFTGITRKDWSFAMPLTAL